MTWMPVGISAVSVRRNRLGGCSVQLTDVSPGCTLWASAMSFARLSLSLAGVVGVIAAALAAATIWLIMTQPVTVADAVAQGEVSPLVKALAGVLYDALQGLMKYL